VHGFHRGRRIPLTGSGPWLIGRESTAQVCLDFDPFVSSRHAEVRRKDDGFEVADLYSRNGTRLDWQGLDRGGQRELADGSIVGVGRSLLVFRTP
jgi:pSer/pThr/pTyr-binding forkhead associated (FHA) protein